MGKSVVSTKVFFLFLLLISNTSCVTIAPPSPLVTYGGPKTTPKKASEAAVAVGTAVVLFEGAHAGAWGWFGRYKYGISEKWDFGIDFSGATRTDGGGYMGAKLATRYQLTEKSRLEFGVGAADDSDGKSLNTDIAFTIGTLKDKPWNYYSSVRLAYVRGYAGNALFSNQPTQPEDTIVPPDTFIGLINLGAEGKVSENQKFIIEGGYGYVFPQGERRGPAFYFSAGLLFTIDGKNQKHKK